MNPKDYLAIGVVQKAKGLAGELSVTLQYPEVDLRMPEVVFILQHHTYVPYPVTHWQVANGYVAIRLEGVTTRSQAVELQGHEVALPAVAVQPALTQSHYRLIGYQAYQEDRARGKVVAISYRPQQPLLLLDYQGRELPVPLHPVFVRHIDETARTIELTLPPNYLAHALS